MGNKLGSSADSRSAETEFPSDSASSRLDEAEVRSREPGLSISMTSADGEGNGLREQESSRFGRGRGGSSPPLSTRSGRWLRMGGFRSGGESSEEHTSQMMSSFRRSNSASSSVSAGGNEAHGGIGLARAGSYIRTRWRSRRNNGVGGAEEGVPGMERRGSRGRGLMGTRARSSGAVEGGGSFGPPVQSGGIRYRTTAGTTVIGSPLSPQTTAEVLSRGRHLPGGLRFPPEGMQQTICPVCRATLLVPALVENFRCPCGVYFTRADRMPPLVLRLGTRTARSISESLATPSPGLAWARARARAGAAAQMTGTSTASTPAVSMHSTAWARGDEATAGAEAESAGAGPGARVTATGGMSTQNPLATGSSMSSSSSPSSSSSSSSSQSLSISPPLSPPGRSSLLGINFANSGSGIARRRPFYRTRSGASTTPSSPLLTPTTSRTSATATTPSATLTAAMAAAEAAVASASAAGAAAGRAAAAAAAAGLPVSTGSSGTPRAGTPTVSRSGPSRPLWSARTPGSRTPNVYGSLFPRSSSSSGSSAAGGSGAGMGRNAAGISMNGIAGSAGVITGGTVTSPVTATGLERRRRRASGSTGSNHIQVVICSICGRGGVIQTPESLPDRSMFFCTCGNPVVPATPAQLLAALSRGTASSHQYRGASPQLINLLPTIEFKEESLRQIAGAGEGGREALSEDDDKVSCRVCLSDYEEGDKLRILPCLHKFHQSCIDKWLGRRTLCPLCNTSVDIVYNDPLYTEGSRTPTS